MLAAIFDVILWSTAGVFLVPVVVLAIEVLTAVAGGRIAASASATRPRLAILIPAHNEATGISAALRSMTPQLEKGDRLVVVADNCTDDTASIAKSEGVEVVARTNLEERGKGFALNFGLHYLKRDPREVVIVVDADCHVAPGAIDRLARMSAHSGRPVQAQYLMRNAPNPGLRMQIAEFAWVVKNLVRPMGLAKLKLPCQLMGSGMAFPWRCVSNLRLMDAHIVEDMKLGLDLARLGVPPIFCPEALVLSSFPIHEQGVKDQRTRWEHGHLGVILSEAPSLFYQGLRERKLSLMAMALDLCIPPLALLTMLLGVFWLATAAFYVASGFRGPLLLTSITLALYGLTVLAAWRSHGRPIISFSRLMSACVYPLLKIPIYVQFVFSRQSEWVRSRRDKER